MFGEGRQWRASQDFILPNGTASSGRGDFFEHAKSALSHDYSAEFEEKPPLPFVARPSTARSAPRQRESGDLRSPRDASLILRNAKLHALSQTLPARNSPSRNSQRSHSIANDVPKVVIPVGAVFEIPTNLEGVKQEQSTIKSNDPLLTPALKARYDVAFNKAAAILSEQKRPVDRKAIESMRLHDPEPIPSRTSEVNPLTFHLTLRSHERVDYRKYNVRPFVTISGSSTSKKKNADFDTFDTRLRTQGVKYYSTHMLHATPVFASSNPPTSPFETQVDKSKPKPKGSTRPLLSSKEASNSFFSK